MESLSQACFSGDVEKRCSDSPLRPKVSSAMALASDQIPTPKKQIQPRPAGKRSPIFSVNDVRRIAMGMRRTRSMAVNSPDLPRSDGELPQKSRSCLDSDAICSSARNSMKLPESFEKLSEFYNCLDSSIRLLRLKGVSSTFTNISTSIQHLTERRFTCNHLAQLKHILPESIDIKKVLLRDEISCCMKPELLVSLQVDSVESKFLAKGETAYSALRNIFRERLIQFVKEHPEGVEIPEEMLPHPFGHPKPSRPTESNESFPSIIAGSPSTVPPAEKLTNVSHFSGSFQKRFSRRTACSDESKSPLACLNDITTRTDSDSLVSRFLSPTKGSPELSIQNKPFFSSPGKRPLSMDNQKIEEDSKMESNAHNSPSKGNIPSGSTPVKEISTPARLMTITPELQAPKRSCKSTIDDTPQKELVKRATRTRLFSTPRKNVQSNGAESISENPTVEDDLINFLPKSLLQDIKEKERIANEERETNATGAKLRKKMIANLPKLLNSILLIFQSWNRSVITKQELIHKILSTHGGVVDRNEVEEQLVLMQELVPDWISQKVSITGDILYRLNRTSNAQEIRQRLTTAE